MNRKFLKHKPPFPYDTEKLVIKFGKVWGMPRLNENLDIEVSYRLKKSFGRCIPSKGLIRLNPILLEDKYSILCEEVICHEAAHYVVFLKNGPNCRPHGKEWKNLLIAAGYVPSVKLKSPRLNNESVAKNIKKSRIHYHHRCLICQGVWIYKKPKRNVICPHCKCGGIISKLTIKTNPQTNK
jgi:predicted SprT family Zn-dependent metalloprotease